MKMSIKYRLFYLSYMFMIINYTFLKNVMKNILILKVLDMIQIILIIMTFFFMKDIKKNWIKIIGINCICFLCYIITGEMYIFLLGLFITACKNISIERVLKIDLTVRSMCIGLTVLSVCLNLISPEVFYRYVDGEIFYRYSLGFAHPNILYANILCLTIDYILIRINKLNLMDFVYIIAINLFFYKITDSKTIFISFIMLIVLIILHRRVNIKLINRLMVWSMPISFLGSIIMVILYMNTKNEFLNILNNLFTGRIYQASCFLEEYGISILGQKVELVSSITAIKYNVVGKVLDNAYWAMLIRFGIIFTLMFIFMYFKSVKFYLDNKKYEYLIVISIFSILGISETNMLKVNLNKIGRAHV